jgi:hypothetical protein
MTGERLVGEPVRSDRPGNGTQALDVAEILGLCDSTVGHPGRRRHLFGWLKAPGAGPEQWLVVDSYYPASRLVVVCRAEPGPDDHVYRELIPRTGCGCWSWRPPSSAPTVPPPRLRSAS